MDHPHYSSLSSDAIRSYSDVRTSRELWTGSTSHCMRISRSVIRKQFPVNRHCILTQDLALTCWTRPSLGFCNSIWLSRPALQKEFAMGANGSSSDSLHNSDGRPKARGRKEGDHWTAWAFDLKSKRSIFYLHMYEDGRVARFGADKRKAFRVKKYDLIWSGEVTAK
ncbi:uncharacterized protein LACBIDRAFT_295145 [Laccaria bicolor S238N-H82]|uniref:Predicted protein n=1 Tax=Laccaria bicolor (strain S238N-H82 / ATCC MYA-4686) TaxID=486041 RepID=B0DND8_LACBS|nr:uncharacterized protein LACBIDRAFT_295145 [Laccaria bicolor S238N-H82]EDR03850.1 predicted protein [Laccaria bicolor S238N-H82]|eukprot:XP_001885418.1 predicted protein [Laccaria bicolor S238N-H82]